MIRIISAISLLAVATSNFSSAADPTTPVAAIEGLKDTVEGACIPFNAELKLTMPQRNQSAIRDYFIKEMTPIAVRVQEITGWPADLFIAHSALETGWGQYSYRFKNLFSVECKKDGQEFESKIPGFAKKVTALRCLTALGKAPTLNVATGEPKEPAFAQFKSVEDSVFAYLSNFTAAGSWRSQVLKAHAIASAKDSLSDEEKKLPHAELLALLAQRGVALPPLDFNSAINVLPGGLPNLGTEQGRFKKMLQQLVNSMFVNKINSKKICGSTAKLGQAAHSGGSVMSEDQAVKPAAITPTDANPATGDAPAATGPNPGSGTVVPSK